MDLPISCPIFKQLSVTSKKRNGCTEIWFEDKFTSNSLMLCKIIDNKIHSEYINTNHLPMRLNELKKQLLLDCYTDKITSYRKTSLEFGGRFDYSFGDVMITNNT